MVSHRYARTRPKSRVHLSDGWPRLKALRYKSAFQRCGEGSTASGSSLSCRNMGVPSSQRDTSRNFQGRPRWLHSEAENTGYAYRELCISLATPRQSGLEVQSTEVTRVLPWTAGFLMRRTIRVCSVNSLSFVTRPGHMDLRLSYRLPREHIVVSLFHFPIIKRAQYGAQYRVSSRRRACCSCHVGFLQTSYARGRGRGCDHRRRDIGSPWLQTRVQARLFNLRVVFCLFLRAWSITFHCLDHFLCDGLLWHRR